jgi:flagellar biosynthetic protein FliR
MLLRELAVGAVFAFAASLPFYAFQWAGELTDGWRREFSAEVLAPIGGERTNPLGELYLLTSVVLFFSLGGHRMVLSALAETLATYPPGLIPSNRGISETIWATVKLFANAFRFAVLIALPVGAVLAITEVAIGLLQRVAPQLISSIVTAPIQATLGIGIAMCALSYALPQLGPIFREAVKNANALVRVLVGG